MFHLISMYSDFFWPQLYFVVSGIHWNVDWYGMIHSISGSSLKMTEDILGYTTTDSPSFAHMKLGILCCESKYRRYWSPSRHGIHNLYRMSDEVTINLRWKISFLCPNATRYDVWYNNKLWLRHWHWGLDIHIYIYCKNANRRSANCMWLWLYYVA